MRWRRTESEHYQRRGGASRVAFPVAAGGGVIGILVALASVLFGGGGGSGGLNGFEDALGDATAGDSPPSEEEQFVQFLAEDIQSVWADIFEQDGRRYEFATVTTFTGQVDTACGPATSAVGPFYCPADQQVYIDLEFFDELRTRFDAPGDFAQAYVVAHEIGHHVQNLLGTTSAVTRQQQTAGSEAEANELSVRLELQADCFAGVWANSVYVRGERDPEGGIGLDEGDIEEGLAAAQAVGDDRIQAQAGMRINPETWTHGSSRQRQEWFYRGFQSGDPNQCDTFSA